MEVRERTRGHVDIAVIWCWLSKFLVIYYDAIPTRLSRGRRAGAGYRSDDIAVNGTANKETGLNGSRATDE
jgi:hypothetical protein